MDFSNRTVPAHTPAPHPQPVAASAPSAAKKPSRSSNDYDEKGLWARIGLVAGLLALVIIVVGVIVFAAVSNTQKGEEKYVDSTKLQAVFLNTGQVYFGKVQALNSKYFVLSDIYYLQTANNTAAADAKSTTSNASVSLVKLGCELHQPDDQMVINRDQVTFWENLHEGGQVAEAVAAFVKKNPSGEQDCADQSSSSNTGDASKVQNADANNKAAETDKATNP